MRGKQPILVSSVIVALSLGMQACDTIYSTPYNDEYALSSYNFSNYHDNNMQQNQPGGYYGPRRSVNVPNSYHVGRNATPASHKKRDRNWASSQNPQGYTIELANDKKASNVAKTLHKVPKNERMAQFKYKQDGKSRYTGVYGTYKNRDEAQKALKALPSDVRNKASVQKWGKIQGEMDHSVTSKPSRSTPAIADY